MRTSKAVKRLDDGDTTFYQFDGLMGFWGVPNLGHMITYDHMPDKPIHIRHNADGNRGAEVTSSAGGEKTIVCFGGSHSWGAGVEQEARYTERLAELSGYRVINLGHCSLGLDQICLAIMQKSARYNPEIIVVEQYPWSIHRIISPYVNGFLRPYFYLNSQQELKLRKVPRLARYKFFRRLVGTYYAYRKEFLEFRSGIDLKHGYDPLTDPIFLHWKRGHYDAMYDLVDKILGVIHDYCRQKGLKLLFGLGTVKQQFGPASPSELVDYELPRDRLIKLLEKNRIDYVDTTEQMLAGHSVQEPVILEDGHINAKGHDIFSRVLYEGLSSREWLAK